MSAPAPGGGSYLARSFGYRRQYVEAVVDRAPARAALAVWSEVARLAFVAAGCLLIAVVCWPLTVAAYARDGIVAGWTVSAGACALAATAGALAAMAGAVRARLDLGRVRTAAAARTAP